MRKCPDCEKENLSENLFCKHCGRCLLAPDPEAIQWSMATHTESYEKIEGIDFDQIVEKSKALRLKRSFNLKPAEIVVLLLLMNWVFFTLVYEIIRYFFIE